LDRRRARARLGDDDRRGWRLDFRGLTLKIGADGKLHLYRSGTTTDAVPPQVLAGVTAVNITGRDYLDDVLTIDYTGGNPIPSGGVNYAGGLLGAGNGNSLALKGTRAMTPPF